MRCDGDHRLRRRAARAACRANDATVVSCASERAVAGSTRSRARPCSASLADNGRFLGSGEAASILAPGAKAGKVDAVLPPVMPAGAPPSEAGGLAPADLALSFGSAGPMIPVIASDCAMSAAAVAPFIGSSGVVLEEVVAKASQDTNEAVPGFAAASLMAAAAVATPLLWPGLAPRTAFRG